MAFDRGGGKGTAHYGLSAGLYEFTPTPQGWELYKKSFQATLENVGNRIQFHYVAKNQRRTLGGGESHQFAGECPPVIRFDNGTGQTKEKVLQGGAYRVAVTADRTLDIYPADAVLRPSTETVAAPSLPPAPGASSIAKAASKTLKLPAGFKLFDPIEALTSKDRALAGRLSPAFNLFADATTSEMASEEAVRR